MGTMQRRSFLASALGFAAAWQLPAHAQSVPVDVWKAPSCGCCKDWVAHLEAHGFKVHVHEVGNTDARASMHIPMALGSCHTARVGGYAIEGHVPAREIQPLLKEKPKAIGLAVPGMPVGSPGMDGPAYGGRRDPYDVLLVLADGRTHVYQSYR
jgi:hypothetical protein